MDVSNREMIGLLKIRETSTKNTKKIADPESEPKMLKPATIAGFKRNLMRTGRDSNPRPPP